MRVGVNGRFYGARTTGVQRFAREIVPRLATRTDVTLFVPGGVGAAAGIPPGLTTVRGTLPGRSWEHLELPFVARRAAVDVVLHPANASPIRGPKAVVVLHDVLPISDPGAFRRPYRTWVRFAHAAGARRAAAIITVSEWSAGEISRLLSIPRTRIHVVTQGVGPLDAPASSEDVDRTTRRHGIRKPYFIGVAGADTRKGAGFLERVWGRMMGPDRAELVLVGGAYPSIHRRERTRRAAGIRWLGHVPDEELRALYTGAVALLFPSRAEGFGRPPLEALACGTRAVVTPYGTAREVLGDAALMIPGEDALWAEAILTLLLEEPSARRGWIEKGLLRARAFSWDAAADSVARVCHEVAEGGA